jgi:hypothetical protein
MRRIEKEQGRQASQIVAVTALSSEEHRSRGLNESVLSDPTENPVIWLLTSRFDVTRTRI